MTIHNQTYVIRLLSKKQPGDSELSFSKLKHNEFIPQLFTSVSADRNKIFKNLQ